MTGTIIDILVIVVILISAGFAFIRGFIREFLTILGVAGGLVAAYICGPLLEPVFQSWFGVTDGEEPGKLIGIIPYDIVAQGLAYISVFFIVVIILSVLSHMLSESIKKTGLGAIDRTLGVFFGLARGVLLVGLLYLPFHILLDSESKEAWFENSRTHFYLEQTAAAISGFIPEDAEEKAQGNIENARERLKDIQILKDAQERRDNANTESDAIKNDAQRDEDVLEEREGYEEGVRENLNNLFQEKSNTE